MKAQACKDCPCVNLTFTKTRVCLLNLILSAYLANGLIAQDSTSYPYIVSEDKSTDCEIVLNAAKIAFESKATHLYETGREVKAKDDSIILWPKLPAPDRPNDDELEFDSNYIECVPNARVTCTQRNANMNFRFVVRQKPFNWQGDWFDLVIVKSDKGVQETFQILEDSEPAEKQISNVHVVFDNSWQAPWLLRNSSNEHVMAIDTKPPYEFLPDWDVYTPAKDGAPVCICKIRFKPESEFAIKAIPKGALHDFAILLDDIIGPTESEGTYRPTDRIRGAVVNMWGNLLFRPWAIAEPYNTRQQVDKGLNRWSKGASAYRRQYDQFQLLYPKALVQLTRYYEKYFQKSHESASDLASHSLDLALRTHFTFPSGD